MMITVNFFRPNLLPKWEPYWYLIKLPILVLCFCSLTITPISAQQNQEQIVLTPKNRTIVQKCFIELDGVKRTFCAAVGEPNKVHYAIDLSTGAIVKIWKGKFLDATTMWTGRGHEQLAKPLGNKILTMKSSPTFLFYDSVHHLNENVTSDFKGYEVDDQGSPTFKYLVNGVEVVDRIWSTQGDTQKLHRKVKFSGNTASGQNIKFRLAQGSSIKRIKKNIFSINNNSYIITIRGKLRSEPVIQKTERDQSLIISLSGIRNSNELEYSIAW